MSNGKGSAPRPLSIHRGEFSDRWDQTFKLREASKAENRKRRPDMTADVVCELPEPQRARD
jgi:hypothetical protein